MKESLIETHVNLAVEPVMELSPSSSAMRVPLFLRPPDVYDPLQIFLNEAGSQEFGVVVCFLVFNGVDLSFAVFILPELPPTDLSRKSVSPSPPWLRHDASVLLS